jgi:hypothetical protein
MHKAIGTCLIMGGICTGLFEATGHYIPYILEAIIYII